ISQLASRLQEFGKTPNMGATLYSIASLGDSGDGLSIVVRAERAKDAEAMINVIENRFIVEHNQWWDESNNYLNHQLKDLQGALASAGKEYRGVEKDLVGARRGSVAWTALKELQLHLLQYKQTIEYQYKALLFPSKAFSISKSKMIRMGMTQIGMTRTKL